MSLPEFALALLRRNFDDPRFVDDACRAVALLHDADDPRLVTLLFFDVLAEGSGLLSRKGNQQSS